MSRHRAAVCAVVAILITAAHPASQSKRAPQRSAREIFRTASQAVVTIRTATGFGSGVVIDSTGLVVTNLHVVERAKQARVRLVNGDTYDEVTVADFDSRKGLALLKIEGSELAAAQLGDSDAVEVGDRVYAIGTPQGLELTLSEGTVSAVRDTGEGYRVIQLSAPISPGSSGGGLFNAQGRLVGVTRVEAGGGENLTFALPINYVRAMLRTNMRLTLAELDRRVSAAARSREAPSTAGAAAMPGPRAGEWRNPGVPRLATRYRNAAGGTGDVTYQSGDELQIKFVIADRVQTEWELQLRWDPDARVFTGTARSDAKCGGLLIAVTASITVVDATTIRTRWKQPTSVDCRAGKITATDWRELSWDAVNAR